MFARLLTLVLISLLTTGLPRLALAVDGVLEINQTCAMNTGCFPGDAALFPVTIAASGSYRLTGNLTVTAADTRAISVGVGDVTLDLNGFSILGPVVCSSSPVSCTPSDASRCGVVSIQPNATVINGTIRGFACGISVRDESRVEKTHVIMNGSTDFDASIEAGQNSLVKDNVVSSNGAGGLFCTSACVISDNAIRFNADTGISAGGGATVSGNTVSNNGGRGIRLGFGEGVVTGNAVTSNAENGIEAFSGSTVIGNTVRGNTGVGLSLSTGADASGYGNNVISNNTGGTVTGGVEIGVNVCNGNTTCP